MEPTKCPECGARINPAAPMGLCFSCLARGIADGPPVRYFGDYELLDEVGRGGMGVVYRARQTSLNRIVAVKMILHGEYTHANFIRRFRYEAETIARLRHPHIVPVYEVGEHNGQPYFSMEFVEGTTLAALAGLEAMPWREAAELLLKIAGAVRHMHEHEVFHRDLKPNNILVDEQGEPRVADFGIAKRLDAGELITATGQPLGAPAFAAPEQLGGEQTVPPAYGDIYSLGAILYFLLTGLPPFQAKTEAATREAATAGNPLPPRKLNPGLPRDLQTICLRCLVRVPQERYDSVASLAADLGCCLAGRPISARPVGAAERLLMWARRNRTVAALSLVLAASLAGGFIGVFREWRVSEKLRRIAETSRLELLKTTRLDKGQKAERLFDENHPQEALATLASALRLDPSNMIAASRLKSALTYRDFALPAVPPMADGSQYYFPVMSPDGRRIAISDWGQWLRLRDPVSGRPTGVPMQQAGKVTSMAFGPDARSLVAYVAGDAIYFWNGLTGDPEGRLPCPESSSNLARTVDGAWAAAGYTNGEVSIINCDRKQNERRWLAHTGQVRFVGFSADNKFFLTASSDSVAVWNAANNYQKLVEIPQSPLIDAVTISPDGKRLLTMTTNGIPVLWEVPAGRKVATLSVSNFPIDTDFSPDNSLLAIAMEKGSVGVYDAATGERLREYTNHTSDVFCVRFSPDSRLIASGGRDNTAQVWDARTGALRPEPIRHPNAVVTVGFSPDGTRLMTAAPGGATYLWDLSTRRAVPLRLREEGAVLRVAFARGSSSPRQASSDGSETHPIPVPGTEQPLFTASTNGLICAWNPRTGKLMRTIRGSRIPVNSATFDNAAARVVLVGTNGSAVLVDLDTENIASLPVEIKLSSWTAFSPDGSLVAISSGGSLSVCGARTGALKWGPIPCELAITSLEHNFATLRFSPDSRSVLGGCLAGHARLWDAATGAVRADFRHEGPVYSAEFSPDGSRVLTAGFDSTARIWTITNSTVPSHVLRHDAWLTTAVFSGDGRRVLTGTLGNAAYVWDAESRVQTGLPMRHQKWATAVGFDPAGNQVLTWSIDGHFRRWDAGTGLAVSEPYFPGVALAFLLSTEPDWHRFAAIDATKEVLVWRDETPSAPVPDWLPLLAEAVAGIRYGANGAETPVGFEELSQVRGELLSNKSADAWTEWGKWYFRESPAETLP